MAVNEGYIKFNLKWTKAAALSALLTAEIVRYRNICFEKKFIGIKDGVGYGNISVRYHHTNRFIISGTQTGGLKRLSHRHFTLVTKTDFRKNTIECRGPVKASAESLTHAMFYRLDKNIRCVIHIHHLKMWNQLKYKVPTSNAEVPYGTVAMSREVARLYRTSDLAERKILVMAGHEEGLISFGDTCEEALQALINHLSSIR